SSMAFLNSLIASSSQPRSANSIPGSCAHRTGRSCPGPWCRDPCSSDNTKGGPRPSVGEAPRGGRRTCQPAEKRGRHGAGLVSGRRVVLTEILEVFARLHGGLPGGIRRLVARQAVGGAAEQLADVAPEHGHHSDGGD